MEISVSYCLTPPPRQPSDCARVPIFKTLPWRTRFGKASICIVAGWPIWTFLIIDSWTLTFTNILERSGSVKIGWRKKSCAPGRMRALSS